ncbi:hypothetical protein N9413_12745, partial [Paracoccaceae bacterium]|nr:hypothetical protein [Paracoccaceae bacterium]
MSNSEFKISSSSNITKKYPVVTSLLDGGFVVIWEGNENESNFGVYGQRYTAEGKELGTEFQVSSDRTSYQIVPSVAPLNDGGFVVTWYSYSVDQDTYEVYGQRFGAATNKTGSEFLIESEQKINPDADPGDEGPSITSFQDGGFLVTWQTYGPDGEDFTVSGRRYDSLGQAEDLFVINPNTESAQSNPVVTALEDGGFVVSWEATGQDGDGRGIFGQLYDSFGNPNGAEFAVNTRTADDQHSPSVASLKNNDFIITWTSEGQDATDWGGIYGQRFDGTGSPSGSEFLINTHVDNSQSAPSVTSLNDNGFVVTWESWGQDGSYNGIYGQRYSSDNTALGEEFQVNTQSSGDQRDSSVSNLHDGGFLVTWESNGQDDEFSANESGIYGQRFNSLGGKVAVNATIINGTENDDFLYGDSDNNIINGLNGDDWLYGELGDDTLDGGEGFDRIDFRGSTSSVLVDFSTGTATGEAIGTDLIFNIERVIGSDFDDLLTGSNTTEAWESYTGGLGDDTINGAGGKDAVWYGRSSSAIYVDLLSETATGGEGTDKLVSIEHVIGSNFADTLIGSEGNDTFSPDALGDDGAGANFKIGGADSINGRGGIDSVSYNNTKSEDGFTPSGILANLSLGTVVDPAGNTDNISNVENVSGSPYDDSITG